MEWVNPKKSDKPKKEKEGIIITKKKEKQKAECDVQINENPLSQPMNGQFGKSFFKKCK